MLITGATGFWGIHLIQELLIETEQEIVCLIRATSEKEARDKLQLQLQAYELEFTACNPRIKVLLGDIGSPEFGLSLTEFSALSESIGRIYHLAAAVNHAYSFDALKVVNVDSVVSVSMYPLKHISFVWFKTIFKCMFYSIGLNGHSTISTFFSF